jgi:2-oxoglutarate ferredoxin oxidoreductase subunit alpha
MHDMRGLLQKNSDESIQVLRHLEEKVSWRASELELVDVDAEPEPEIVLVSYGITTRAAQQVMPLLRERGHSISHAAVKSLFPVPWYSLDEAFGDAARIIVAEERSVLERRSKGRVIEGLNKIGSMITPTDILNAVEGHPA